jgi:hypothetical protein
MFIGHYKAVNKTAEFYSVPRDDLQFPTQVIYGGERYLLGRTVQLATKATEKRFYASVKDADIPFDIKID